VRDINTKLLKSMPTKAELKDVCKQNGIKGYSKWNKQELSKKCRGHLGSLDTHTRVGMYLLLKRMRPTSMGGGSKITDEMGRLIRWYEKGGKQEVIPETRMNHEIANMVKDEMSEFLRDKNEEQRKVAKQMDFYTQLAYMYHSKNITNPVVQKFIDDVLHDSQYNSIISFEDFQTNYREIMETVDEIYQVNKDFRMHWASAKVSPIELLGEK
jgi:hypothetical protein